MTKPKHNPSIEMPVTLGKISIGEEGARIPVKVERKWLSLDNAVAYFCDSALKVRIESHEAGIPGVEPAFRPLTIIAASKTVTVARKHITAGLSLELAGVDPLTLAAIAEQPATLTVETWDGKPLKKEGGVTHLMEGVAQRVADRVNAEGGGTSAEVV